MDGRLRDGVHLPKVVRCGVCSGCVLLRSTRSIPNVRQRPLPASITLSVVGHCDQHGRKDILGEGLCHPTAAATAVRSGFSRLSSRR